MRVGDIREEGRGRVLEIARAVREAVAKLRGLERSVIEEYYFDGLSVRRIAEAEGVSVNRVMVAQRLALRQLRVLLTPFVTRMFGIGATCVPNCPICAAPWREDAEAIIDGKTSDVTWGQIMTRIERATGWNGKRPQILIAHQRKHRGFETERKQDDQITATRGACFEAQHFDGPEGQLGEFGEDDGTSPGGCMPDSSVDGFAGFGGDR